MNLTVLVRQMGGDRACGSAFLVDQNQYNERRSPSKPFIPTSLLWTLGDLDYDQISCCHLRPAGPKLEVDLGNGTSVYTRKCSYCQPFNGNPYLLNGCYGMKFCILLYIIIGNILVHYSCFQAYKLVLVCICLMEPQITYKTC